MKNKELFLKLLKKLTILDKKLQLDLISMDDYLEQWTPIKERMGELV